MAQVSDVWDGSMLVLRLDLPWTSYPYQSVSYAMVVVHHIDDDLANPTLGDKVLRILSGLP